MGDTATGQAIPERGFWAAVPGRRAWLLLMVLLLLLLLGVAAWMEWLRQPPVIEKIIPAPQAALSAEVTSRAAQLQSEVEVLEKAIADARAADPTLLCPPGQRLEDGAAAAPAPLVAPADGPLRILPINELADRLEGATVLVLSDTTVATGFFVAPNLLVTNRHAVEGSKDGKVLIASRSLGQARAGQVLRKSPEGQPGAADFALVKLLEGAAPAVLPLTSRDSKLTAVVAAGYPGLTLQNDPGFRRLVAGDAQAAPDLNLTQGVIQSSLTSPQGVPVLVHTASILQGNSGGPLVDTCGRVLGVNTFIAVDAEQSGRVSYAQTSVAMNGFLAQSGGKLALDERDCPSS
ncbi:S1 family peptidase [Radicibacter daui]|uniref:S1 family peptidase n=1 Tax=Radicibacter daui TaxID=3064829 RepID=UPI004046C31D